MARYRALSRAMAQGLVASCHDCSDGGLGVALAETAFAGGLGLAVDLAEVPNEGVGRDDVLLFSESTSRFVVTVRPEHEKGFQEIMTNTGTARVGVVTEAPVLTALGLTGQTVLKEALATLKAAWQKTLDF